MRFARFFLTLTVLMIWPLSIVQAGTTGKVVGTVTHANTGEALEGVNVILLDTQLGAATNADGEFIMLRVPPGIYNVKATMIGFGVQLVENIFVSADLTTRVDFQLAEEILTDDILIVTAKRPLIQKDVTSWESRVASEEIANLPVQNVQDVVSLQAGVTKDATGNLHIRGGRSDEVLYMVDGISLSDPLQGGFGSELENQGQSRQTVGSNLDVSVGEAAVNELVLVSGTFNAEYGNAMSGLINIITKESGQSLRGKFEYTSDYVNDSPYRQQNALVEDKNPGTGSETGEVLIYEPPDENFQGFDTALSTPGRFQWTLSGPIPGVKRLGFFTSGEYSNADSYLPHGFDLNRSGFTKLTYNLSDVNKIKYTYNYNKRTFQIYSHAWKYLPQNQGVNQNRSQQHLLSFDHMLTSTHYFSLKFAYTDKQNEYGVWDWADNDFRDPETEYVKGDRDNELEFYTRGTDDLYLLSKSKTYNFKGDLNAQMGLHHDFKLGFDVKSHDLSTYKRIEPWPDEGGANRTIEFDHQPLEAAVYLQDKIEYDFMTVNAGLRLDYVDVKAEKWVDTEDPLSSLEDAPKRYQLSPRLGMAFPISERMIFHFSYGHFFQMPSYSDIYANLVYQDPDRMSEEAVVLVGNPGLEPQKTVSIESGLKHQFNDWSYLKLTAYHKDLTNLVGTRFYRKQLIYRYSIYTNVDYGNVKGLDLSWGMALGEALNMTLNYSYSIATGNSSFPTDQAFNAYFEIPEAQQEYPLDFDQRHRLSGSLQLAYPVQADDPAWLQTIMKNLSANVVLQYASGYPYTPVTDDPTLFIEPNSARMPWTATVDMRVQKRLKFGRQGLTLFTEITNLFDRTNALRVQPYTGELWDTGKLDLLGTGTDYVHNPADAGTPRLIRVGMSVDF